MTLPSVIAGSDRVSVLEHPGKVRGILEADGERDARDASGFLARVGEQPGRQIKPPLQDPAEWRRALRLEEQVQVTHGHPERLGNRRRRQAGIAEMVSNVPPCPQQLSLSRERRPDVAGEVRQDGGQQFKHVDADLPDHLRQKALCVGGQTAKQG